MPASHREPAAAPQVRAYVVRREDSDNYAANATARALGPDWLAAACLAPAGGPLCGAPASSVAGTATLPPARRGYGVVIVPDGPFTVPFAGAGAPHARTPPSLHAPRARSQAHSRSLPHSCTHDF